MLSKLILLLFTFFTIAQIFLNWTRIIELSSENNHLKSELLALKNKQRISNLKSWSNSPTIFFVTPTAYRAAQKADLTRLGQTLANVQNLFWIVVEDSEQPTPFIDELMARLRINGVHLAVLTPPQKKANISDPNWKYPRGVEQRNSALKWIRDNLASSQIGVLYFGDDDNTYDWRLFDEIRNIKHVGIWPVGIVGGLLVETPLLDEKAMVRGFNARWKPGRPFPIDMAAFAVNLSLVHHHPETFFTFKSPRGFLESYFLESLGLSWSDLEPQAENCTKVFVWHTRTEKTSLIREEFQKFITKAGLNALQRDAIF